MLPTRVLRALPPTIAQTLRALPSPEVEVTVHGWVASLQPQKHFSFVKVTDGSSASPLQVFVEGSKESKGSLRSVVEQLSRGTSVAISGSLVPSKGRGQSHELKATSMRILGSCPPETYLLEPDKKDVGLDQTRERAHLRMRMEKGRAVAKTRDQVARLFRRYFEDNEFVSITTPILTSADCEGAGEMFRVESAVAGSEGAPFFPPPGANLTVSSQLHLELYLPAYPRVYTLSPCFRAEASHSARHLAEFWMLEAEAAFTHDLGDVMDIVEGSLKGVARGLLSDAEAGQGGWDVFAAGSDVVRSRVQTLAKDAPWTRITYRQALDLLAPVHAATPFQHTPTSGSALQTEHEKHLAAHFGGPVFVTDYPKAEKSFYMLPNADGETVACFDLLIPEMGELAGGSLREHRLEPLLEVMRERNMKTEGLEWYLDMRRFGSVPHGGYGLGLERFLGYITGIGSLRDIVGFPRTKGDCRY